MVTEYILYKNFDCYLSQKDMFRPVNWIALKQWFIQRTNTGSTQYKAMQSPITMQCNAATVKFSLKEQRRSKLINIITCT